MKMKTKKKVADGDVGFNVFDVRPGMRRTLPEDTVRTNPDLREAARRLKYKQEEDANKKSGKLALIGPYTPMPRGKVLKCDRRHWQAIRHLAEINGFGSAVETNVVFTHQSEKLLRTLTQGQYCLQKPDDLQVLAFVIDLLKNNLGLRIELPRGANER